MTGTEIDPISLKYSLENTKNNNLEHLINGTNILIFSFKKINFKIHLFLFFQ